jgi:serine phosphatase RsbU (regulator of sigma subunit)/putative methionine-R-sulfoxide reductase with GAF domain
MDLLVLRGLADNIAIAIEGIHLYKDLWKRAEQLSVVAEVSRAITSILDPDALLNEVAELIQTRFGFPFVHLFSVHAGRRLVIYQAGSGSRSHRLHENAYTINLDDPVGMIAWAARNGKTLLANDVHTEPLYRATDLPSFDTRSEMAVPLLFGGEVLGVLDIQSTQVNAFSEDDRFVFEALADNISVAIRNARLYQSEKWRRQVAESLRDVAGMLTTSAGPAEVLDAILTRLERILPCDVAAIWLLDDSDPAASEPDPVPLTLAAIHGGSLQDVERIKETAPEKFTVLTRVIDSNQTLVRADQDPIGPLGTALGYSAGYSSIVTPLRVGNRPLGVLALAHATSGRYGSEALAMTSAFASYAAVAIENNRLVTTTQEQAWVATVMLQVAEATQALNTVDELLSTVSRLTPMLAGVRSCAVFLYDAASQAFTFAAHYGLDPDQLLDYQDRPIYPGEASAFDELRTQRTQIFLHHNPTAVRGSPHIPGTLGHNPLILFPLLSRGEILGVFLVEHHHQHIDDQRSEVFGEQQRAILLGIVQQTTIAVENIRLLESKQEDAYVTAVLLQVAQAVVSFHDLNDILDTILNILPILVGIDASMIILWNAPASSFQPTTVAFGSWQEDPTILERSYSPEEFPLAQAVVDRDALVVCDLGIFPIGPGGWHTLKAPPAGQDVSTLISAERHLLLGFPLSVKGQPLGVLLAQDASSSSETRLRRFEIINGVAQQAALAIENDRLTRERLDRERLEREFQLARQIQQSFLPDELPSTPGWEFDVRWRPARQVGGDFYDCFPLPDDRIGLVIADVSDKGMAAALYMTVTRTLFRAAAQESSSPAEALARVNSLLLLDAKSGMFVTAVYAVVSLASGEMVYSIAGHNLPLHIGVNHHEVVPLIKGGVALGVIEDVRVEDHRLTLQPGDTVVFYTDGVTEAYVPPDQTYGDARLTDLLATCRGSSAEVVLEEVDRSLSDFLGEYPPSDDVTLLAIHRSSD